MDGRKGIVRNLAMITQLALYVMVPIFLCLGMGILLESWTGIPLTLPFLVLGIVSGARTGYVSVMEIIRSDEERRRTEQQKEIQDKVDRYGKA